MKSKLATTLISILIFVVLNGYIYICDPLFLVWIPSLIVNLITGSCVTFVLKERGFLISSIISVFFHSLGILFAWFKSSDLLGVYIIIFILGIMGIIVINLLWLWLATRYSEYKERKSKVRQNNQTTNRTQSSTPNSSGIASITNHQSNSQKYTYNYIITDNHAPVNIGGIQAMDDAMMNRPTIEDVPKRKEIFGETIYQNCPKCMCPTTPEDRFCRKCGGKLK